MFQAIGYCAQCTLPYLTPFPKSNLAALPQCLQIGNYSLHVYLILWNTRLKTKPLLVISTAQWLMVPWECLWILHRIRLEAQLATNSSCSQRSQFLCGPNISFNKVDIYYISPYVVISSWFKSISFFLWKTKKGWLLCSLFALSMKRIGTIKRALYSNKVKGSNLQPL